MSTMPTGDKDALLAQAVRELNGAILALRTLIEKEYPNRREIEARFMLKTRSTFYVRTLLVTVLVAGLLSFLGTVTTVSQCFLGPPGEKWGVCQMLPGYEVTMRRSDRLVSEFEKERKRSVENRRRIERLEDVVGVE